MGLLSKITGRNAEYLVLGDLHRKGYKCRIIETKSTTKNGKKAYTSSQGCDIIGTSMTGRAVFVEVKKYARKSLPISESGGIKLSQIAYLMGMSRLGANAWIAIVTDKAIFYVNPLKIVTRVQGQKRKSYAVIDAMEDCDFWSSINKEQKCR